MSFIKTPFLEPFIDPCPAIRPSRGVSAVQPPYEQLRGGGINAFVTYILKYICFSSKFNFCEFHFFCQPISYSNFKLCCLVKDKCYGTQHPEKSYTAMYVIVFVWLHIDRILHIDCLLPIDTAFYFLYRILHIDCILHIDTAFYTLFTVFLLYFIIPGFCCPHVHRC